MCGLSSSGGVEVPSAVASLVAELGLRAHRARAHGAPGARLIALAHGLGTRAPGHTAPEHRSNSLEHGAVVPSQAGSSWIRTGTRVPRRQADSSPLSPQGSPSGSR